MSTKIEPKIIGKPAFCVAGIRYAGKNEHGEIPAMWDNEFLPRLHELASIQVGGTYGVARAIPGVDISEGWEYLACLEVARGAELPEGMIAWDIPAFTWAVLPAHDVPEIGPVSDYLIREWLPNSPDWEAVDGPMLEFYPETFDQDKIIYLHFGVKPKS